MAEFFTPSKVKLKRARQHLTELQGVLDDHMAEYPPKATFTAANDDEGANAQIVIDWTSPPECVGAIVGDIVHNLRAALDLMAVELVSLNDGGNTDDVYFPFCQNEDFLDKMIVKRNFNRAGPEEVRLLKELKPYKGGNAALRALHDLDIQDKHHSLIPSAAAMTTPEVAADMSSGKLVLRMVEGSVPVIGITFPADGPLAGAELIPALQDLIELVEGVLEAFAAIPR